MNCDVFKTRKEAEEFFIEQYGDINISEIVYCCDVRRYAHIDDTMQCCSCGEHFTIDYEFCDGMCAECFMNAEDEDRNLEELRKDYYDSVL
jgi:hypothetical protein